MYIGCFDTRADWHLLTVLVSLTEEGYFHSLFPCKGAYRELVLKVGVENFGPLRLKKSSEPALSRSNSLRLRVFKIESWGCDFFSIFHWSYFVATGSAVVSPWVMSLCDPVDCGPPVSSVHGVLQARILKCVAMPFSRGSSGPRDGLASLCLLHCRHILYPLSHLGSLYFSIKYHEKLSPLSNWLVYLYIIKMI